MLVGCLALLLSASNVEPSVSVLVSRRTGVPDAVSERLSTQASRLLAAEGVPLKLDADAARAAVVRLGLKDSAACDGRKRCLGELAQQLGVEWVVGLSFAQVGADRSMGVELFRQVDGSVVAKDALLLNGDAELTREQLAPFAARVRQALGLRAAVEAPPPLPPPDAPVSTRAPTLTPPEPPPPPPLVTQPLPAPKSHVASIGLGAGAAAALIAGTALLVSGLVDHADAVATQTSGTERLARYPADEVLRRANDADARTGAGAGLAGVAVALGVAAVLAW